MFTSGSTLAYIIGRWEIIALFSGYLLIILTIRSLRDWKHTTNSQFVKTLESMAPTTYAISGLLYIGLLLKNMYPHYTLDDLSRLLTTDWLKSFSLLTVLFFIPYFSKKPILSLWHNLILFAFLFRDVFKDIQSFGSSSPSAISSIRLYIVSNLYFIFSSLLLYFIYFLFRSVSKKRNSLTTN